MKPNDYIKKNIKINVLYIATGLINVIKRDKTWPVVCHAISHEPYLFFYVELTVSFEQ